MIDTFAPSFKFVKQTITVTSSCEIMAQKSAIVLGLGPVEMNINDYYLVLISTVTNWNMYPHQSMHASFQDCYRKQESNSYRTVMYT